MQNRDSLVLIVDDNATNIDLLVNTLKEDYRLGIAKNGPKALEYAARHHPDLILLDIMMPEMNGYEVCGRLQQDPETSEIPVIFITALDEPGHKTHGFEVGGVDYVTKPFHAAEVKARVRTHLTLRQMRRDLSNQNVVLEKKVNEKTAELQEMLNATVKTMAFALEMRDPYTAGHQQRVAHLACAIAEKLALSQEQIQAIRFAGILHDIGKIRIPTSILNRPGRLLDVEMELIKLHPQVGFEILQNIPAPWPLAEIVHQHHERLDGSGYPRGLKGDQILREATILTVSDVVEAGSSFRPYRPARGLDVALEEITTHRGVRYTPDAVDACLELLQKEGFRIEPSERRSAGQLEEKRLEGKRQE
ncbi:MAG: response regulator [Desulfobacteraceae bacterium]|nr:response regulator [Desulfobacteraceae bacterium]